MTRGRWVILVLVLVATSSGCCGSCGNSCFPWLRGSRGCGGLGFHDGCTAGSGCGPAYWGDWYEGRASCWDPCDWCGNYTGGGGIPATYNSMGAGYPGQGYEGGYSDGGYMDGEYMDGQVIESGPGPQGAPTMAPQRGTTRPMPNVAPPPPSARKSTVYRHR